MDNYGGLLYLYLRAVWLLYLWGKWSILQPLGFVRAEFEEFEAFITRVDGRINGQEEMFAARVPSGLAIAKLLYEFVHEGDVA